MGGTEEERRKRERDEGRRRKRKREKKRGEKHRKTVGTARRASEAGVRPRRQDGSLGRDRVARRAQRWRRQFGAEESEGRTGKRAERRRERPSAWRVGDERGITWARRGWLRRTERETSLAAGGACRGKIAREPDVQSRPLGEEPQRTRSGRAESPRVSAWRRRGGGRRRLGGGRGDAGLRAGRRGEKWGESWSKLGRETPALGGRCRRGWGKAEGRRAGKGG